MIDVGNARGLAIVGPLLDRRHLSVGLLTADLMSLGSELELLARAGIEIVHFDVMDGVFCPQLTFGTTFVAGVRTPLLKDVHLMVDDPLAKLDGLVAAGADMITFHVEGARQPHRVLQALTAARNANDPARGILRGIALNPSTPVDAIEPLLELVDYALVLGINPGYAGQSFLPATADRVARAREVIARSGRPIALGVDGGVTRANIQTVAALGTDVIVTGSAIFDGGDVVANARAMRRAVEAGESADA